jgi:hypothetical protein
MGGAEKLRLAENKARVKNWRRWGTYLSERQWGTVREDYSSNQESWEYFTHDQARSRAYRWGEDGLMGWTDRECRVCFAPALWNGKDPILKERLFGLSGKEGNHGEDVKECYYYLDATPTHSYTKGLYKYPHACYPYSELVGQNVWRDKRLGEIELADMGLFKDDAYFDVMQEVAKRSPNDLLWKISITNHGKKAAPIQVLPNIWFRNVWTWDGIHKESKLRPTLEFDAKLGAIRLHHEELGEMLFHSEAEGATAEVEWLFTENETNRERIFGKKSRTLYTKDAFHRHLVNGQDGAVNPARCGTKGAAHWKFEVPAGATVVVRCRLHLENEDNGVQGTRGFEEVMSRAHRRVRRVLSGRSPERGERRGRHDLSARLRRLALDEAILRIHRQRLDSRRIGRAGAGQVAGARSQQRLGALLCARHPFHAGQVGIPVVRRVGHGLSHDAVRED